jgi:hypothetical protein
VPAALVEVDARGTSANKSPVKHQYEVFELLFREWMHFGAFEGSAEQLEDSVFGPRVFFPAFDRLLPDGYTAPARKVFAIEQRCEAVRRNVERSLFVGNRCARSREHRDHDN